MPDDCGLKPPIETLPQIAQERAMVSSGVWSDVRSRARTRGRIRLEGPGGAV